MSNIMQCSIILTILKNFYFVLNKLTLSFLIGNSNLKRKHQQKKKKKTEKKIPQSKKNVYRSRCIILHRTLFNNVATHSTCPFLVATINGVTPCTSSMQCGEIYENEKQELLKPLFVPENKIGKIHVKYEIKTIDRRVLFPPQQILKT